MNTLPKIIIQEIRWYRTLETANIKKGPDVEPAVLIRPEIPTLRIMLGFTILIEDQNEINVFPQFRGNVRLIEVCQSVKSNLDIT